MLAFRLWLLFTGIYLVWASSTEDNSDATPVLPNGEKPKSRHTTTHPPTRHDDHKAAEASRAYKQALSTLTALTANTPSYTQDSLPTRGSGSFLTSLLPNFQGQGPVGTTFRIAIKLLQNSYITRLTSRIGKDTIGLGASRKKSEDVHGKAIKVIDLLQHSAELGNTDALFTLAKISLFPPSIEFPSDPALAYNSLMTHATLTGNASSQALLGFFHATGYSNVVPVDQAKAHLYYTFSGLGDDPGAQMVLGYRYWSGIGTGEDCRRALDWYEKVSEKAMARFAFGPPGGRTLPQTPTRLSDLAGGAYGPGASVASTGYNAQRPVIKAGLARAAGETWEDILEYYSFNADREETDFAYRLGKIFYQGSIYASRGGIASGSEGVGAVPRDFHRAKSYFTKIARSAWPQDSPSGSSSTQDDSSGGSESNGAGSASTPYAAASAGYLGRMYLRGEGVKADAATAKLWFERGAQHSERESHNGLGIIWRDGLVQGRRDLTLASQHFFIAANQDLAEAQVNFGKLQYERGELKLATSWFETAMRQGSPFEAYYYLGSIYGDQAKESMMSDGGVSGSCPMAVAFHKLVAERGAGWGWGTWGGGSEEGEDLLREAEDAWTSGTERGREMALLKWRIAAEQGFEVAQNNLAFVLDQDKSILRLTRFSPFKPLNETSQLALTQWRRSAAQHNVDALVKVGDYYYHGLGVAEEEPAIRLEKAARFYRSAADTQMSALAMWNLGWMYENGVGVPQDFHLAKRHYDLALETNTEAYLPVVLSLIKLYGRSLWHTLIGGKDGLSLWSSDEDHSTSYSVESRKIEGGREDASHTGLGAVEDQDDEGGEWYLGKAKEQFERRHRDRANAGGPRDAEEDLIQWARDRRNAEREREEGAGDFGPEDYFDAAMRGGAHHRRGRGTGEGAAEGDEIGETLLLVLLCVSISILLYVRRRLVDRMRRDHEEAPQGEEQQVQRQVQRPVPPQPPPDQGEMAVAAAPAGGAGDVFRPDWPVQ